MAAELETVRSTSPTRPSEVLAEVPATGPIALDGLAERGRAAAREWAALPASARAAALQAAADRVQASAETLVDLMVREVGKPLGEAKGELARSVAILRYFAQQAFDPDGETFPAASGSTLLMARRRPLGLVGLITPWNFPLAIPLWKAAPALAFGNAVLLKPAPEATACALALAGALRPALPEGVLQLAPGDAPTGQALLERVDAVSFTGSIAGGRAVAAAAAGRGVRVQAEMGGQNASIVLPDADLEAAAAAVAGAAMGYAGQKCTATSRAIVVGNPASFTEALQAAVRGLAVGDPAEAAVTVGPLIGEAARDAVVTASREVSEAGGEVIAGGEALDREGWFVAPTLVRGVSPDSRVAQEEVFGPICAVLPAAGLDEAVEMANGVRHGLVSAVFTRDLDAALACAARLDTGIVRVNAATTGVDFHAPFGGEKASSYGPREQGKAAREFYTSTRTITIAPGG